MVVLRLLVLAIFLVTSTLVLTLFVMLAGRAGATDSATRNLATQHVRSMTDILRDAARATPPERSALRVPILPVPSSSQSSSVRTASAPASEMLTPAPLPVLVVPSGSDVVEETVRLPVVISDRSYNLEALVVRRPGAEALPVALITHGSAPGNPRDVQIGYLRRWAYDFAHRGWLAVAVMRRGYGHSDGVVAEGSGNCTQPDVRHYLEAHADDLEAALRSVALRRDADMSRVLAIGQSAGGAAVMALAARHTLRLVAAVNVSGGLAHGHRAAPLDDACDAAFQADLVRNFADFGAAARMPTLWVYARNDSLFSPDLVQRMQHAFIDGGGAAELIMEPPFETDGHALFYAQAGMREILPALDGFLRANGLPTWSEAAFAPLLARLPPQGRNAVEDYLKLPTEKALALGPGGGVFWLEGGGKLDEVRTAVLDYCRKQSGGTCTLAAENFELMQ